MGSSTVIAGNSRGEVANTGLAGGKSEDVFQASIDLSVERLIISSWSRIKAF